MKPPPRRGDAAGARHRGTTKGYNGNPKYALSAARRFAVVTVKANGAHIVFGTYTARGAADLIVEKLAQVGCAAHVEVARPSDCPGLERRAP